ncbi:hypothetical protein TWF730_002515 [Orbilia blumenaviensis]|uniref:Uncharacterized protein n=1 Tax=Orbilia blumenaviensis TaxID=1796055 RepID=A0AAV9UEM0_9PEZI
MAGMISHLEILYGVDHEGESIPEINGGIRDINSGFGGEFVFLKAIRVERIYERLQPGQQNSLNSDPRRRLQYIGIERFGNGDPGKVDLAKGAGGDFRFLTFKHSLSGPGIYDVALWRSGGRQSLPPADWTGMSSDINEGRGGTYLYIVWKMDMFVF